MQSIFAVLNHATIARQSLVYLKIPVKEICKLENQSKAFLDELKEINDDNINSNGRSHYRDKKSNFALEEEAVYNRNKEQEMEDMAQLNRNRRRDNNVDGRQFKKGISYYLSYAWRIFLSLSCFLGFSLGIYYSSLNHCDKTFQMFILNNGTLRIATTYSAYQFYV